MPASILRQQFQLSTSIDDSPTLAMQNNAGSLLIAGCRWAPAAGSTPSIDDTAGNTWTVVYAVSGQIFAICASAKASPSNEVTFHSGGGLRYDPRAYLIEVENFTGYDVNVASGSAATAIVTDSAYTLAVPLAFGTPADWASMLVTIHGSGVEAQDLVIGIVFAEFGFLNPPNNVPPGWTDIFPSGDILTHQFSEALKLLGLKNALCQPVADIVLDLCRRAGLDTSLVDVSLLTEENLQPSDLCCGFVITRQAPAADLIRILMSAYFFDACESDGRIIFVPRGLPSVASIPQEDIGLATDNGRTTETIGQEQDLPRDVTVIYADPGKDYQQGKQMKTRNSRVVKTKNQITVQIPMTMAPDFARQVAEKTLYLKWLEKNSYVINLWRAYYMLLDATDVILFTDGSVTFRIRATEMHIGQGYVSQISGVGDNSGNYLSTASGGVSSGSGAATVLAVIPATLLALFDLPLLRDTDAKSGSTGFYFSMSSASPNWKGGNLIRSSDNSFFQTIDQDLDNVDFGYTSGILGNPPRSPFTWDETNTLTIKMTRGLLAGDTESNVLNGSNVLIVGNEVLQFVNCIQNMDGSYTISKLLRGRRGTEWAAGFQGAYPLGVDTHAAGELVVNPYTGLHHHEDPLAIVNLLRYYRGVTVGQDESSADTIPFTNTGNDLRPYAPTSIAGARDISQNLTITWIRRTRIGGDWLDGQGTVPVSEDSEAYEVDVMSGSSVLRTISGLSSPTASYSAADQTTDFGSAQASLTVKVYQISGEIGRGFAGKATI
jgi:hypothetical protein